jgi:hypothetical protein
MCIGMSDHDPEGAQEEVFECFDCGTIVTREDCPGEDCPETCPECGGELRSRSKEML